MLMLPLVLALVRALHQLAIWALARSLNMPEPLVHDTGIFVVAQVVTIENRVGQALCPKRLWRQVGSWFR
jgi:hypothetical protein